MFVNDLTTTWLPAVPDLDARLQADPPAWVVEVACGAGWASIALAQATARSASMASTSTRRQSGGPLTTRRLRAAGRRGLSGGSVFPLGLPSSRCSRRSKRV
jgi:hypothetical protein